jgi:stage V sporulation protein G
MEITEVQVKLVGDTTDRLKASCSITIDGEFVIRDVKVIEGTSGLFVAMPSRKLTDHCPKCRHKNHLRARHCNHCGAKLGENRATRRGRGPAQLHADVAHPINSACRERIQTRVISSYEDERELAKSPDYKPPRMDEEDQGEISDLIAELKQDAEKRRNGMEQAVAPAGPVKEESAPVSYAAESTHETDPTAGPDTAESEPHPRKPQDDFGAGLL